LSTLPSADERASPRRPRSDSFDGRLLTALCTNVTTASRDQGLRCPAAAVPRPVTTTSQDVTLRRLSEQSRANRRDLESGPNRLVAAAAVLRSCHQSSQNPKSLVPAAQSCATVTVTIRVRTHPPAHVGAGLRERRDLESGPKSPLPTAAVACSPHHSSQNLSLRRLSEQACATSRSRVRTQSSGAPPQRSCATVTVRVRT
jgi:hypothetical protein